ncbi:protein kinase domain-containing protein [Deinococcus misasensis]|uniref:protein kinase domain-containing protein n=1 Tax=Deinococcus misasensis TaxID=392413 RepID=UPI00146FFA55|nr:protein kinase [Deinococcus misasensis]
MNCPSCNAPIHEQMRVCPACGMPLQTQLKVGTRLQNGRYSVGKVLGQGGFGITYLGANTILKMPVAIKELFMEGMSRGNTGKVLAPTHTEFADEKLRFLDEARRLGRFSHPNIVRVLDVFEENNTVYLVMEHLQGETLAKRIEVRGKLSSQEVLEVLYPILDALQVLHSENLLHRDIKPPNIFLTSSGRTVLIDFGSVRTFAAGKESNHTRLVTVGYAPLEQYSTAAKVGPYTDLYAVGATLFHALTGTPPPSVLDRINGMALPSLPEGTDPVLAEVIQKTLALQIEERPQNIAQMRGWLLRSTRHQTAAMGNPTPNSPPEVPSRLPAPPADERLLSRSGLRYAVISRPLKAPLHAREQGFHYDFDTESVVEVENGILRLAFKSRGFDPESVSIRWIRNDGARTDELEMFDLPLEIDMDRASHSSIQPWSTSFTVAEMPEP